MNQAEMTRAAIRAGMAYTGVTQQELAREMGISPKTLSLKMNGMDFKEPELYVADRIVNYTRFMGGRNEIR